MDTRIKERLTGAIVLVAIVVLVVPALLSGPRQETRAPEASEGPTREMVIDLASRKPAQPEDPEEPQAEPTSSPAPAPGQVLAAPTGIPELPVETAAPAPAADATSPAVVAPAPAAPGQPQAPPAAQPAPVRAAAPAVQPTPAVTAWAVQLGAFSTRDTAQKLVSDLKGRGYAAFLLEYRSDGKVLYRVRVGPEQDRARAVAVAERLKREGYERASVAPHP